MTEKKTPLGQTAHEVITEEATLTDQIPKYRVVLLDDDAHTYAYVIEMLMDIFGHPKEAAFQMAVIVDTKKRVVVETTFKERAEMKRDQIHAYGPDWRIPTCKGSMSAIVEPVDAP
jgi:ATP-dependent Clp protease adaptor protein ClpS